MKKLALAVVFGVVLVPAAPSTSSPRSASGPRGGPPPLTQKYPCVETDLTLTPIGDQFLIVAHVVNCGDDGERVTVRQHVGGPCSHDQLATVKFHLGPESGRDLATFFPAPTGDECAGTYTVTTWTLARNQGGVDDDDEEKTFEVTAGASPSSRPA